MNNDSAAWKVLVASGKSHLLELQFVEISGGSTSDGVRQPSEAPGSKAESGTHHPGDDRGAQVLKQEVAGPGVLAGSEVAGPGVLAGSRTLAAIPVDRRVEGLEHVLRRRGKAGVSLVVQWLRIHFAMQGTPVWSLVGEDPTCHGATKPGTIATEPALQSLRVVTTGAQVPRACALQQEKPLQWGVPAPQWRVSGPQSPQLEKSPCKNEDPAPPKINNFFFFFF